MKSVLLVDDDTNTLLAYGIRLKALGYRVYMAKDGVSALNSMARNPPDVVVSDISMPAGDGFTMAARLQRLTATAGTPIIFMSGSESAALRLRAQQLGASALLLKPMDPSTLVAAIESALSLRSARPVTVDFATATASKGYFDLMLSQRMDQARKASHSLCLILTALDGLPDGARSASPGDGAAGDGASIDAPLSAVASAFRRVVTRPADLIARYDTGLFATLLPDTGSRGGMVVALRTSAAVDALKLPAIGAQRGRYLTLSIGLAVFDDRAADVATAESLMKLAQGALNAARAAGGHAVRAAQMAA